MKSIAFINTSEISPGDIIRLARGCKRLYLDIMATPDGKEKLDAAWDAYQKRKRGEEAK